MRRPAARHLGKPWERPSPRLYRRHRRGKYQYMYQNKFKKVNGTVRRSSLPRIHTVADHISTMARFYEQQLYRGSLQLRWWRTTRRRIMYHIALGARDASLDEDVPMDTLKEVPARRWWHLTMVTWTAGKRCPRASTQPLSWRDATQSTA